MELATEASVDIVMAAMATAFAGLARNLGIAGTPAFLGGFPGAGLLSLCFFLSGVFSRGDLGEAAAESLVTFPCPAWEYSHFDPREHPFPL